MVILPYLEGILMDPQPYFFILRMINQFNLILINPVVCGAQSALYSIYGKYNKTTFSAFALIFSLFFL